MDNNTASTNLRRNLEQVCRLRGMSQRELSRRSTVHYVTVNRIMRGWQEPTIGIVEKLAQAAGIPLEKIFSDSSVSAIDGRKRGR